MGDFTMLTGYILALVALIGCILYWTKAAALAKQVGKAEDEAARARQQFSDIAKEISKLEEKLKVSREATKRAERFHGEALAKLEAVEKKYQQDAEDRVTAERKRGLIVEDLQSQLESVTQQLVATDRERSEAEKALREYESQSSRKADEARKPLEDELRATKEKLAETTKELRRQIGKYERLTTKIKAGDFPQMVSLRRKLNQHVRLYSSMRGLREMAEERNRNWEHALRFLAIWVLEKEGRLNGRDKGGASVGELVGEALETVGAPLIAPEDDIAESHHIHPEHSDEAASSL